MGVWELLGWVVLGVAMVGVATTATRWCGNVVVAVLQLVMPWSVMAAALIAVVALIADDLVLACVATGTSVVGLFAFVPKLRTDPHGVGPASDGRRVTITLANLFVDNPEPESAFEQLLEADSDLLVMTELTPELVTCFDRVGGAERYPFRIHPEPIEGEYVVGIFCGSRMDEAAVEHRSELRVVGATWTEGDHALIVRAIHPEAPTNRQSFGRWRRQLREARLMLRELGHPAVMLGDLNAGTLQVPYERLLESGFRDAHAVLGQALAPSWGIAPWLPRWVPTFVARLDHLLVSPGISVVQIDDLDPVGSDHRPFKATVCLHPVRGSGVR